MINLGSNNILQWKIDKAIKGPLRNSIQFNTFKIGIGLNYWVSESSWAFL